MRISGPAAAIIGALVALTATGCASTIAGDGRLAADATRSEQTTESTDSTEPTESTEPTQTTTPTDTDTGDGELDCPGESVSPPGAPYCYTAPTGLDEVELGDPTAGESGSFRTSYGFGPTDHVEVQAYVVGIDTDTLTDDEIVAELVSVIADLEAGGFDFEEQPTPLTVDGARGFAYQGTSTDGSQNIVTHFIFRGLNEVQINCAYVEEADVIDSACAEVLGSMQIID